MYFMNIFWVCDNYDPYFYKIPNKNIWCSFNYPPYNNYPNLVFDIIDKNVIIDAINNYISNNKLDTEEIDYGTFKIDLPDDIKFYAKLSGLT